MTDDVHHDSSDAAAPPAVGFLRRATERMKAASVTLKDEYRKGREGDDSPVQRIGPNAIDAIKAWLASDAEEVPQGAPRDDADAAAEQEATEAADAAEAAEVADLLGRVNWNNVSGAARDSAAAQRMKDLADKVDWAAAKPVAARVAAALIAAAAAGELGGMQGAAGRYVARTIANEMGLADRVAQRIRGNRSEQARLLVDYIDTTATEAPNSGFEANVADLRRLGTGD
ncbi:MAG: hypothetical protein F2673_06755 [Actinobacteria bacterium]|uniref:Unannotated protein n=1 Tax=freshwater metagenome TaxID=449393 RepID=A0A6J6QR34_9ZZZZ|nr:hypothetical protein [Actinomycetota bacterium]